MPQRVKTLAMAMPYQIKPYSFSPTFGIKLEFILVTDPPLPANVAHKRLAILLSTPTRDACSIQDCRQHHGHCIAVSRANDNHAAWNVRKISAACVSAPKTDEASGLVKKYKAYHVVLTSPAFTYTTPGWIFKAVRKRTAASGQHTPWFSPEWEIKHVLRMLNDINKCKQDSDFLAIYTNPSCSFEVYIGNGKPSTGLRIFTAKNLLAFGSMFERVFDDVHSADRIRTGLFPALEWFQAIESCENYPQLFQLAAHHPLTHSAIDVLHLQRSKQSLTVKFCQHVATLDAEEVMAWVHTTVKLTIWMDSLHEHRLREIIEEKWMDLGCTLPDLLRRAGADGKNTEMTIEHYKKLLDDEGDYALKEYEKVLNSTNNHPLRQLLTFIASEKLLRREATELSVTRKMLMGEYGWLPSGTPQHITTAMGVESEAFMKELETSASGEDVAAEHEATHRHTRGDTLSSHVSSRPITPITSFFDSDEGEFANEDDGYGSDITSDYSGGGIDGTSLARRFSRSSV